MRIRGDEHAMMRWLALIFVLITLALAALWIDSRHHQLWIT